MLVYVSYSKEFIEFVSNCLCLHKKYFLKLKSLKSLNISYKCI